MAYLSQKELELIGFAKIGDHVRISDKASIYNPSKISLGSYVRIDDFALLSAGEEGIVLGSYIHISCYATLIGHAKITLNDFVAISIKATILSSTAEVSGDFLPSTPELDGINELSENQITKMINEPVTFETNTGLGAHSIVMPGVTVGMGSGIGAMSVVYQNLNPWGIYMGNPARFIRKRSDRAYQEIQKIKKNAESKDNMQSE